ncbi:MAG TPA: hypothetical protein PLD37_14425 [Usitatibacteraceae bacterium]|nr:hypothetical protein [Usitatibacteraceae bacterium]
MSQNDITKDVTAAPDAGQVLDATQVEGVGGGVDLCTPGQLEELTRSLTTAYENLVDFTSHVIGRVLEK